MRIIIIGGEIMKNSKNANKTSKNSKARKNASKCDKNSRSEKNAR